MSRPRVLMVTGSYFPETSGANLQCRQLISQLVHRADFEVLTTTSDASLDSSYNVDGITVRRVLVDPRSVASKATAAVRMTSTFMRLRNRVDIVHLHGFSQKSILITALALAAGKKVVIKLTSVGHDDPVTMKKVGGLAFAAYSRAHRFIGVSPRFEEAYREVGLPAERFRLIPNAVDVQRFRPSSTDEKRALRKELGLPLDGLIVLFVGFFSGEKRPDLLFRAWATLYEQGLHSTLVLIGATQGAYYEIRPEMADNIRFDARRQGLDQHLIFVERTDAIAQYYRAADVFALPTLREGLPNALLETMASGVPPVITRLSGVTDWIVENHVTGILVPPRDHAALSEALERLLRDPSMRHTMGQAARRHVETRFGPEANAAQTLAVYEELLDKPHQ